MLLADALSSSRIALSSTCTCKPTKKKLKNTSNLRHVLIWGYMTYTYMFGLHTLPWYWKAITLAYDVLKCWQQSGAAGLSSAEVYATTVHVFLCQILLGLVLMGPSILLSVPD
jgi:hypothetical protein